MAEEYNDYKKVEHYIIESGHKIRSDMDNLICHVLLELYCPDNYEVFKSYGIDCNDPFRTWENVKIYLEEDDALNNLDFYA